MGNPPAEAAVAGATKTSYKGGWLDKDLRRANGRVGLSTAERPAPPAPHWAAPRPAPKKDLDGWVVAPDDSRFEVCANPPCGAWTGQAKLAVYNSDGSHYHVYAEYSKRGCECVRITDQEQT